MRQSLLSPRISVVPSARYHRQISAHCIAKLGTWPVSVDFSEHLPRGSAQAEYLARFPLGTHRFPPFEFISPSSRGLPSETNAT